MRKIVAGIFMSLDGVIEGPGPSDDFTHAGWTMPYFNDEIGGYISSRMMTADALLVGRTTYETFKGAFEPQTGGVADVMNNFQKYVVSTTLKSADWQNSMLINGDVIEAVRTLKQQSGQDISISGSGTLIQSLLPLGLVDELSILLYPVILGTGKRLLESGLPKATFTLIEARPFSNGVVLLRYQTNESS